MRNRQRLRILHGQDDVITALVAAVRIDCADKFLWMSLSRFHIYRELFNGLLFVSACFPDRFGYRSKTLLVRPIEVAAEKRDNQYT